MERQSKRELLATIERQNDQIKRYEARLRDVVQAYKGLQKEKTALEKSLKVLSPGSKEKHFENKPGIREQVRYSNEEESREQENDSGVRREAGTSDEHTSKAQTENSETNDAFDASSSGLETQVQTLRESLQTVMEQKTKMENSFQADKKNYLQELQEKEDMLTTERSDFFGEKQKLQQEIQELRNRTRQEQQARESEQNDHVIMLKEMQLVVSKERLTKEELQSKLDRLNRSLTLKNTQTEGVVAEQDGAENKTADAKDASKKIVPSPTLLQLQEEMIKMKTQLEKDILTEQLRANEAEERAALIAKAEEQRVADLEAKLSELSEVVGKYEKLRLHDQSEIQKLKDRIHEFNTYKEDHTIIDNRDVITEESSLDNDADVNELFRKVKDVLRSRAQNNDVIESEVGEISKTELEYILQHDPAHKVCQQELRQLKDEFECYKSKVQTFRTKHEATSNDDNVLKLQAQVSSLKRTVESLQRDLDTSEAECCLATQSCKLELRELCVKHEVELEKERMVYTARLQELEEQVRNQRSRTLALIAEKDCEVERLQTKLNDCSLSSGRVSKGLGAQRRGSGSETAVKELLSQASPSSLVHYAQEQAFCEAELELLKKQRLELEDTIREHVHREEQTTEQVKFLKEEIRKLERNRSRENANLEYVKNVILRYLLTDSESVRQQMVAAISQILQFSPKELSNVKKKSRNTWWK